MQLPSPALFNAAKEGRAEVLAALIAAKSEVNAKINDRVPLHEAALNGHTEAAKILINAGSVVDSKDLFQRTPLHEASMEGHTEIVQLLLAANADVNARDGIDEGACTPLHWAASRGHVTVVNILIEAGSDLNTKTHREGFNTLMGGFFGYTPLDLARQGNTDGHREVEAALLERQPLFKISVWIQSQWTLLSGAVGLTHKKDVNTCHEGTLKYIARRSTAFSSWFYPVPEFLCIA
jgi:ankyrin repeat protein